MNDALSATEHVSRRTPTVYRANTSDLRIVISRVLSIEVLSAAEWVICGKTGHRRENQNAAMR
jgi:hypothetical protein